MIKLNLSNAYDLIHLGANYNKSNLYLGYVKTKGYVLIQETNNNAFFHCIKSSTEPFTLNINWQFDTEEIKEINEVLNKILKFVPNDKLMDIKTDVIGELLESLTDKAESYNYIKPKDIDNPKIKEFALNPVEQFNFYIGIDDKPLSIGEFKKQKAELRNDLENCFNKAVSLFNNSKAIYGETNPNGDAIAPLIDEKSFINLFNSIISDAFGNPIVNLMYGNGKSKLNTIYAIDYITEELNIKGVYRNGKETIYYFNEELNYFEPLTVEILKNLIIKNLGVKLLKGDYNTIYNSIETNNNEYNNILVFKNILFDMDYMQELNYPICNYNRADYLAPALIGYEDKNNDIQLLDYDADFDYMTLYAIDPNPNDITFVEKTLRQILIPKDNPTDLSMFHDYLQRVGSCILGKNKYKVITLYFAPGNNGKGILKLLMELIFNNGAFSLTPQTFDDDFNLPGFTNKKVLLLDEIDKKDFNDCKPTLKRISSPEARIEQRGMHSQEYLRLNNFPNLFIFSNVLINLELDELALFSRFDFLELPNTFVSEKELNKIPNSYPIDRDTEAKIKADIPGLSWLITASIQAFRNMQNSNSEFILRQTTEQTMDILLDTDYLTKFIRLYTYDDASLIPIEFTTVEEIYQQYLQYMELNGNVIADNEITLKRRIGTAIKKVYNIPGKLSDSEMYYKQDNKIASYRVKLKSFDDVDKEFKRIYIINDDVTDADLLPLDYSKELKIVYGKIQNGVNTINLLNKDLPNQDNYKIVRELLNLNLIIMTTELNLTDVL